MPGKLLYTGPSQLDGKPVIAIATWDSKNIKTGDMIQTWIIRSDMHPMEAIKTGDDSTICGQCPHRGDGVRKRSCYVSPQGPSSVYRAYLRGAYSPGQDMPKDKPLRIGSYGDPAAVPYMVWAVLVEGQTATGHTGYTHQWRNCDPRLAQYCMASCDSVSEAVQGQLAGWRTFTVQVRQSPVPNSIVCANTTSGVQCSKCLLCGGTSKGAKSITIEAHGSGGKVKNFAKMGG